MLWWSGFLWLAQWCVHLIHRPIAALNHRPLKHHRKCGIHADFTRQVKPLWTWAKTYSRETLCLLCGVLKEASTLYSHSWESTNYLQPNPSPITSFMFDVQIRHSEFAFVFPVVTQQLHWPGHCIATQPLQHPPQNEKFLWTSQWKC